MGNPFASKGKKMSKIRPQVEPVNLPEEPQNIEDTNPVEPTTEIQLLGIGDLTVKEALEFVGDDKEIAAVALAEEVSGDNRKTLVSELEKIVNG